MSVEIGRSKPSLDQNINLSQPSHCSPIRNEFCATRIDAV